MLIDNVVNVLINPLPIGNHPFFKKTYDNYATKFNSLAEKLENKGINVSELRDVVEATKNLERLGYLEAYRLGINDGSKR